MSVSGGSSGSSSQTQTHIDFFLNGLNLFGKTYTDTKYAAIFETAKKEGHAIPAETIKALKRARRKNYAATAFFMLYRIERGIRKNEVMLSSAREIRKKMYEIETLLRQAGWSGFNDKSYQSSKSATAARMRNTEMNWHEAVEKNYMDYLRRADAASYTVKDIEERISFARAHAKATKTYTATKKREIEKVFAQACARCCESRLNRLQKAPFIARMDAKELHKEEQAIKALYAASSINGLSSDRQINIDEAIQNAHRRGIGETLTPDKLQEMPLEDKIRLADRVAIAKIDNGKERIIMAALSQAIITHGRSIPPAPTGETKRENPCRDALAAACASLRMAQPASAHLQ